MKISTLVYASILAITPMSAISAIDKMVNLENDHQSISINPNSLLTDWMVKGYNLNILQPQLLIGGKRQLASKIKVISDKSASWLLTPSNIKVITTFDNGLKLSFITTSETEISRKKPLIVEWFDLPEEQTNTLVIPFNEGMRIPTNNKVWIDFMASEYSGSNTTQDLKMPFWSVEVANVKNRYVNYILLNPTNNNIDFTSSNNKLDMTSQHTFTVLNRDEPFEVMITLGRDQLDAAKEYRRMRKEQGLSKTLYEKSFEQPQITKLIGASHVYLFGKDALSEQDVIDWWGLNEWFFIKSKLKPSKEAKKELSNLKKGDDWFSKYHKRILVESINSSLDNYIGVEQAAKNQNNIKNQYEAAQKRKSWLAKNAGSYLINSERWGQAISTDMVNNLSNAGIDKLWLGLDNWMPAFYQPGAVELAKKAGYLVGTYDSYDTAIAKGINDTWLTAQLPDSMRENCSIEQTDGTKKKGFRGNGYYLNPVCNRSYVEQRVKDVIKYGRFNSLFLDVDATGMAREDYSKKDGMSESDVLNSFNDRMSWIASNQNIVLGSEDGNSTTTQGIAFAHGMETVGFGWTDKDMKTNRQSPYFLGAWYPDSKPDFFFRKAKVKQPYKDLFFAPQFKVPLYQTVFHDELINSHHWHTDSLKFTDVKVERDLISMLYNTPAMVHLSRDEATSVKSPRIKALKHYQDGFKPMHEALWDQSIVGFKWLDKKGLLQQTTYSDGSIIIANFSKENKKITGKDIIQPVSIVAYLSDGTQVKWESK